jgi:hypothetical protein
VKSQPISARIVVGSVAAAATTGALVAMGHRVGHVGIPFAAIGAVAFQRSAGSGLVGLVFTGFVLHVATMFMWGAICVWLAARMERPMLVAGSVAVANFLCSWLVAWATGKGLSTVLPLGDRIALALILAVALVVGMRYAFSSPQIAKMHLSDDVPAM